MQITYQSAFRYCASFSSLLQLNVGLGKTRVRVLVILAFPLFLEEKSHVRVGSKNI